VPLAEYVVHRFVRVGALALGFVDHLLCPAVEFGLAENQEIGGGSWEEEVQPGIPPALDGRNGPLFISVPELGGDVLVQAVLNDRVQPGRGQAVPMLGDLGDGRLIRPMSRRGWRYSLGVRFRRIRKIRRIRYSPVESRRRFSTTIGNRGNALPSRPSIGGRWV
jgi:hypothetical protein